MKKFLVALMLGALLMGANSNCSGENESPKPYCAKWHNNTHHKCDLWKYPPKDKVA